MIESHCSIVKTPNGRKRNIGCCSVQIDWHTSHTVKDIAWNKRDVKSGKCNDDSK